MLTLPAMPAEIREADVDFVRSLFDTVERFRDDAARCEVSDPALSERLLDRASELSDRARLLMSQLRGKLQVA